MKRGKYLVWLAAGNFVALSFALPFVMEIALRFQRESAVNHASPVIHPIPWSHYAMMWALRLFWAILLYSLLRRQQWARWIAVVIWAARGLSGAGLGLFLFNASFLSHHDKTAWGPLLLLLAGLVSVVNAGILVFPESVGDFFAMRNWSQAKVTVGVGRTVRGLGGLKRDDLLRALPGRRTVIRRGRIMVVVAVVLCWVMLLGLISLIAFGMSTDLQDMQQKALTDSEATSLGEVLLRAFAFGTLAGILGVLLAAWLVIFLVIGYIAVFIVPFVLALPLVLPFARRWQDPVRFLILRPFNKDRITTHLARFLRDEFAPFGHCYTLSDRKVRVPLHIRVPFLLGQLSFFNFRFRRIRQPQHIAKLVQAMQKRVRRNLNWCFSGSKLFPISCCDPGWRACVARLVQEVDIVVADLTSVTENVAWELKLLRDGGALERTVFVVEESQATAAQERISELVGPSRTMNVVPYGPGAASKGCVAGDAIMDILCCGVKPSAGAEQISCLPA